MIITIARKCGCNGDEIGRALAKQYQIPLYDKQAMIEIAKEKGIFSRLPNFFSENPVSSMQYAIAEGEYETEVRKTPLKALKEIISEPSFIVIGRCGNYVFKEQKNVCRIFLTGNMESRVHTIMEKHAISEKKAKELIEKTDSKRASFQSYYTGEIWGNAGNYDICLDISKLGVEGTVHIIQEYIRSIEIV